jgi:hypothetical protein
MSARQVATWRVFFARHNSQLGFPVRKDKSPVAVPSHRLDNAGTDEPADRARNRVPGFPAAIPEFIAALGRIVLKLSSLLGRQNTIRVAVDLEISPVSDVTAGRFPEGRTARNPDITTERREEFQLAGTITRKQAILAFFAGITASKVSAQGQTEKVTIATGPVYGIGFSSEITDVTFTARDRWVKLSMDEIMDALGAPK